MTEAELVRAKLEVYGIEAVVQADSVSGAVPFLEVTEGVRVFVRPPDLAEAFEILERMLPAPEPTAGHAAEQAQGDDPG
jgi:hypothetical protein